MFRFELISIELVAVQITPHTARFLDRDTALESNVPVCKCLEAFPVPRLLLAVTINIHRFGEYGQVATLAARRRHFSVMVEAEYFSPMFVVRIIRPECIRTNAASEMLRVVISVKCRNPGASDCSPASAAKESQPLDVVLLAKQVLVGGAIE